MDTLSRELRASLRRLAKTPGFTAVVLLTLTLSLGATTTIFTLVNSVMLRNLPFPAAERLVSSAHTAPGLNMPRFPHSEATFLLDQQQSKVAEAVAIYDDRGMSLTSGGDPARLRAAAVTASFFDVLSARPALGRLLRSEDQLPSAAPVVILSDRLWHERFGADPGLLGKTIELDGVLREVVGITAPRFSFPNPEIRLFVPMQFDPARPNSGNFDYEGIARLAPGKTPADFEAELNRLLFTLPDVFPGDITREILEQAKMAAIVHPLLEETVRDVKPTLFLLLASVGLILAIACANVANLFLVRSEGRLKEMAIHTALGAGGRRLLGSLLTESLLLTLASGAFGLALAALATKLVRGLEAATIPRLGEISIDLTVVAFTFGLCLVAALVVSASPALRLREKKGLAGVLRDGTRSATVGRERRFARNLLVGTQVALALVLLAGSGLLLKSFWQLSEVHPGFEAQNVLTLRLAVPKSGYPDEIAVDRYYTAVLERVRALPGVEAAGAAQNVPLTDGHSNSGMSIEDFPRGPNELPFLVSNLRATPGYFEAMGIPLRAGRTFLPSDTVDRTGAVVVSEAFAKKYWPQGSALGKRLKNGINEIDKWFTIVGVVGDVRDEKLADAPADLVYFPQVGPEGADHWASWGMGLAIKSKTNPEGLAEAVRQAVWSVDPKVPIARLEPMQRVLERATAGPRLTLLLLLFGAGAALALGALGIYGVLSYLVGHRTREIGVRMALGARREHVVRSVVAQGALVVACGMAVGLAGALGLMRYLGSLLYEVSPTDPTILAGTASLLAAVALTACYLPARRAAAIEPVEALRRE